jgi:hypothetical protein
MFSALQTLFGYFLIVGHLPCRRIFIEALTFGLYLHCNIASALLSFTHDYFEPELYVTVLNMYRAAPYKTLEHFMVYPETYVFCGWILFVYGVNSMLYVLGRQCRKA